MRSLPELILLTTDILHPAEPADHAPWPIRFPLDAPRAVALVIDDESGNRLRNLIGAQDFQAGHQTVCREGMIEDGVGPMRGALGLEFAFSPHTDHKSARLPIPPTYQLVDLASYQTKK